MSGGLIKDFETAWKAYEDVALPDRSMPKFSRFKTRKMHTLSNRQSGCVRQVGEQLQIVDKWLLIRPVTAPGRSESAAMSYEATG